MKRIIYILVNLHLRQMPLNISIDLKVLIIYYMDLYKIKKLIIMN